MDEIKYEKEFGLTPPPMASNCKYNANSISRLMAAMQPGESLFFPGKKTHNYSGQLATARKRTEHILYTKNEEKDGVAGMRVYCLSNRGHSWFMEQEFRKKAGHKPPFERVIRRG